MDYEEKRELRKQISQLLADAGLNQGAIKKMVEEEIKNKVDRAVDQTFVQLNAESSSGDYCKEMIQRYFRDKYTTNFAFTQAIKEELKNRVIDITLRDVNFTNTNQNGIDKIEIGF